MNLDYFYRPTVKIKKQLEKLEVLRQVIELLPQLPHIEENLRRQSLLKSSLFSARIEGNRLKLEDINLNYRISNKSSLEKREVFNILQTLHWLYSVKAPKKITLKTILKIHQLVLADISPEAGQWRFEQSAIFDKAGIAVYLPPPAIEIKKLLVQLLEKTSKNKRPGPMAAAIFHFGFEKIHPFLDGNGRVGRLLATLILKNNGFGFRGLISFEEYLENNRQEYYDLLATGKKDLTNFIGFFLKALITQAEKIIKKMKNVENESAEETLLPRRQEILNIIKDHHLVSFDFIKRRFVRVAPSTLHYDLKQLVKSGFIIKLGATKGVYYSPKI